MVCSRLSWQRYARKRVIRGRDSENNRKAQEFLIGELKALKELSHRHLVRVVGSYTDSEYIAYLMQPVAECNLDQFLNGTGPLTENAYRYLREFYGCLAGAVHYLHTSRIRHRDLTSRNILIRKGEVYISDFGSAYNWSSYQGSTTRHLNTPVSRDYMAPEIAKRDDRNSASDMWSLGVVYLEITTVLLGKELQDFRNKIEQNARKRGVDAFIYANLPVAIAWLETLREGNKGPVHDNEPLAWVRDLLQEYPDNRPTARLLMKDILESASFNIFCCFKCHDDFRAGAFQYDCPMNLQETAPEDTQTLMERIAAMLPDDDIPPPPGGSSTEKSTFIEQWLAEAEDNVQPHIYRPSLPQLIPEPPLPPEIPDDESAASTIERYHTPPPSMPGFYPGLGDNPAADDALRFEPFQRTADLTWRSTDVGILSSSPKVEVDASRFHDNGLGFLEYEDTDSSSEGNEAPLFYEIEDCSESDSNCTLMPNADKDAGIASDPCHSGQNGFSDLREMLDELVQGRSKDMALVFTDEPAEEFPLNPLTNTSVPPAAENASEKVAGQENLSEIDALNIETKLPVSSATRKTNQQLLYGVKGADFEHDNASADGLNINLDHREIRPDASHAPKSSRMEASKNNSNSKSEETLQDRKGRVGASIEIAEPPNPEANLAVTDPVVEKTVRFAANATNSPVDPGIPLVSEDHATNSQTEESTSSKNTENPVGEKQLNNPDPNSGSIEVVAKSALDKDKLKPKRRTPTDISGQLSSANVKLLNKENEREVTTAKVYERKKREPVPGISPSVYMQEVWESASSVATSKMSENSRRNLLSFPWKSWDKHRLLEHYCLEGKPAQVRLLLENGCNPGTEAKRRSMPIFNGVKGRTLAHNKCVRALINKGSDVDVRDRKTGKTPLHFAIENADFEGYTNLIFMLVEAGANTNLADLNGDLPLMKLFYGNDSLPLEENRRDALALLLYRDTRVNLTLPGTLNTPLHSAVRRKDAYAVGMLLHKGADVTAKNSSGITPLQLTANQFRGPLSHNHFNVLDLLLTFLTKNGKLQSSIDEPAGALERTPLHHAVAAGAVQAVEILLEKSASQHCQDKDGCDALAVAAKTAARMPVDDHVEIMALLVQATKNLEVNWPVQSDQCVVELACEAVNPNLMQSLLARAKLDPNSEWRDGRLLHRAIGYANRAVMELLVRQGAFVDATKKASNEMKTGLGRSRTIDKELLLQKDNGTMGVLGEDAIAYAIRRGEDSMAEFLVQNGKFEHQKNVITMEQLAEKIIGARK